MNSNFSHDELCSCQSNPEPHHLDHLTKVVSRRHFYEDFTREWKRFCREQKPLSLLLLNIDFFKSYNDTYGHQLGDDCLIQLAQALQQAVRRPNDLVARYGGEEFVVLLPDTDQEEAIAVAENIRAAIKALNIPHSASEVSDRVTVSIGISTCIPCESQKPYILIEGADMALYRAKQQGRDRFVTITR
ncbi:diguanylate cyclase domain protein [Lyngbya aestuarii BL J]|uniref:Diguanylate cyclase domain protein n=1 Tax=Lyngbya aestuarii BL J TaxID=1348334 RepID=U7QC58_9CYAN|nr:diguanylate cyclase [Lyngbya aestuarii]ERT05429.1 diguanylate cyclase domain protein [Lyngbya aestuarii BL J]